MSMATRWLRSLALLTLLTLLSTVGAVADTENGKPEEEPPEVPKGRAHATLDVGGPSGAISELVFGKNGRRLYTIGFPGEVHEWDVESGERLRVWRFPHWAMRCAVSPDGKQLVVGTQRWPPKPEA